MTGTGGTVLAVDDDSDLRSLYRCWLASSHEVRTAADGERALRRLDDSVDVVLLDREMPGTDGVAVARELERRDIDPVVVMISGVEPDVDLLDIPVDDYLQKPVDRATVLAHVQRAQAVASQPRPRRHLVALERRRQIVEAAVSMSDLGDDPAYQRTTDTLECHSDTLEAAHATLAAIPHDDRSEATTEPSLRKSP